MTKADIIEELYQQTGIPRQEAVRLTELVLDIMKESLKKEGKVKISGFGNFVVRAKKARQGRNPQTGEDLTITPRKVLGFKPSSIVTKELNGK